MRVAAANGVRLARGTAPRGAAAPSARMMSSAASAGTPDLKELLIPTDQFTQRHLGPSKDEVAEMCKTIGVKDIDELMNQTIPDNVRSSVKMAIEGGTNVCPRPLEIIQ